MSLPSSNCFCFVFHLLLLRLFQYAFQELNRFLDTSELNFQNLLRYGRLLPEVAFKFLKKNVREKCEFNLDLKLPHFILPEEGKFERLSVRFVNLKMLSFVLFSIDFRGKNLLIIDFGKLSVNTEIRQETEIPENATQMELEEQLYSRLYFKCDNCQVLFCDSKENWKDARKEKDTELHLFSKFNCTSIYSTCIKIMKALPQ